MPNNLFVKSCVLNILNCFITVYADLLVGSFGNGYITMQQNVTSQLGNLLWSCLDASFRRGCTASGFPATDCHAKVSP